MSVRAMSVRVMSVRVVVAATMFALASTAIVPAAGTLDYDFYKAKVQPIFLVEAAGPRALRDVPRRRQQHAAPGKASRRASDLDRGTDAQEFRYGFENRPGRGRSADRQNPHCIRWRPKPAATPSIPAAGNSPRRTIPTGRPSPNGRKARRWRRGRSNGAWSGGFLRDVACSKSPLFRSATTFAYVVVTDPRFPLPKGESI